MNPARYWINQPSHHQPLHHLHGTNVIALPESTSCHRVYFLTGDNISAVLPSTALSKGWTKQ